MDHGESGLGPQEDKRWLHHTAMPVSFQHNNDPAPGMMGWVMMEHEEPEQGPQDNDGYLPQQRQ